MEKLSRNSRVSIITKVLIENPNKIIGLNKFSDLLNAAKSTISEDIVIVREVLSKFSMGKVETIAGAAGGIRYIPEVGEIEKRKFLEELCDIASESNRVVPGNFLYVTDIMFNPSIISKASIILASYFQDMDIVY